MTISRRIYNEKEANLADNAFIYSDIRDEQLRALSPVIEKLTSVTFISCSNLSVQMMPLLGRCTNLQSLTLRGTSSSLPTVITDHSIYHLSNLTNLKTLDLSQHRHLTGEGLKIARYLTGLISLDLSDCPNLKENGKLQALKVLTGLQALNLDASTSTFTPEDLEPLPKSLTSLDLSFSELQLNYISTLTNLTSLDLFNVKEKSAKLTHLTALTKLITLNCALDKMNDLSMVKGGMKQVGKLTNLTALQLSHFTDQTVEEITLRELTSLTNLKSLGISNLSIEQLDPITYLTHLTWLNLSFSPRLREDQIIPLAKLPNLTFLDLTRFYGWENEKTIKMYFKGSITLNL